MAVHPLHEGLRNPGQMLRGLAIEDESAKIAASAKPRLRRRVQVSGCRVSTDQPEGPVALVDLVDLVDLVAVHRFRHSCPTAPVPRLHRPHLRCAVWTAP